ncbi:MAG: hypothetical protein H7Z14_08265, partial [Anaerolineae bacterium]|nr:hypothetical protein [Phycisphaerae bacterium]
MSNNLLATLLAAAGDPNGLSVKIAEGALLLLLLAGIVKCFMISRRPTTNTRSALGLMFVLIGLLIGPISSMVARQFEISGGIRIIASALMYACA